MVRKPLVVDEPVDRWFSRPLAHAVVFVAAPTPITANQLTALGSLFGVAAGVAAGMGEGALCAAGIVVFLIVDCADGQLARLRGVSGFLGRTVDGLGDYATAVSLHVGLILWMARDYEVLTSILWGAGAALSMAWNSFLLDRYKRRFTGSHDDLDAVRREMDGYRGWRRFALSTFLPYASRLDVRSVGDLVAYRERARLPMLLWLIAGPTSHLSALAVLAFFNRPLLYAWVACGAFNLLALLALFLQRRVERPA